MAIALPLGPLQIIAGQSVGSITITSTGGSGNNLTVNITFTGFSNSVLPGTMNTASGHVTSNDGTFSANFAGNCYGTGTVSVNGTATAFTAGLASAFGEPLAVTFSAGTTLTGKVWLGQTMAVFSIPLFSGAAVAWCAVNLDNNGNIANGNGTQVQGNWTLGNMSGSFSNNNSGGGSFAESRPAAGDNSWTAVAET